MSRLCISFIFLLLHFSSPGQNDSIYGQPVPKHIPEIFAPGIVSIEHRFDLGLTISRDGKFMIFGTADQDFPDKNCLYMCEWNGNNWESPSTEFLNQNENAFFPQFGPAGKYLYYTRSDSSGNNDIYRAEFMQGNLSGETRLSEQVNSASREAGHGMTLTGVLYFTSNRDETHACCGDVYRFDTVNGLTKVGIINSEADEEGLYISPDERYIIIQSWRREYDSKHDLYISYRDFQGNWTPPERLPAEINSNQIEQRPFVTTDKKYLFFSRSAEKFTDGHVVIDSDTYWVTTGSVFKPYVFRPLETVSVKFNQPFNIKIPDDLFLDIDEESLSYSITQIDGGEIPKWMNFDDKELKLNGYWLVNQSMTLIITAGDSFGNQTEFHFQVNVE